MSNLVEQDLKLKGHIYFNRVEEGVYFQGQGGGFIIKGDIYLLISRIISFIDAGHRLKDIRSQLPERMHSFFDNLIAQFAQNDMLMPREGETLAPESWLSHKAFNDFFTYLEENATDFVNQFRAWQVQKVMVVGEGYALKAAVEALAVSGLHHLHVLLTNENNVSCLEVTHSLEYYAQQLAGFTFDVAVEALPKPSAFAEFDHVIQCETQLNDSSVALLGDKGVVAGVLFGQGVVSPVSPISESGYQDLVEQVNRAKEDSNVAFPKAGIAMLGSLAALNVIKQFFGIQLEGIRNYVYRVSPYLGVTRHPLFPVLSQEDSAQLMQAFQAEFEMPDDRELEKYEHVKLDLAAFFDPIVGCLNEAVGDTVKQVPLFHSKLAVRFAASAKAASQFVLCCGLDASTAGLRAIGEALTLRSAQRLKVKPHLIHTAFDDDQWRKCSTALMLANAPGFFESAQALRVNMMFLEDEEMQLIMRFVQSHGYSKDALVIHFNAECSAFVASMPNLANNALISRVGASAFEAIQSCLCAVYVQCQFPEIEDYLSLPACDLSRHHRVTEVDTAGHGIAKLMQSHASALPEVALVHGEPVLASFGIYSGYASLKEAL